MSFSSPWKSGDEGKSFSGLLSLPFTLPFALPFALPFPFLSPFPLLAYSELGDGRLADHALTVAALERGGLDAAKMLTSFSASEWDGFCCLFDDPAPFVDGFEGIWIESDAPEWSDV